MDRRADLIPMLRMGERVLIVLGGIFSIYLGYRLFTLGVTIAQGTARAFGIELRDFGPGLLFAALGAYVLSVALRAAVQTGSTEKAEPEEVGVAPGEGQVTNGGQPPSTASTFFFGVEDPNRQLRKWSAKSFFLDTRALIRQLDAGKETASIAALCDGLKANLAGITMSSEEYARYQVLTNKADLTTEEQRDVVDLEQKLFP